TTPNPYERGPGKPGGRLAMAVKSRSRPVGPTKVAVGASAPQYGHVAGAGKLHLAARGASRGGAAGPRPLFRTGHRQSGAEAWRQAFGDRVNVGSRRGFGSPRPAWSW